MSKKINLTLKEKKKIIETAFKTKLRMHRTNEFIPCIFHSELSPSMSVNVHKGTYNCFSCGAKGDISKLQQMILEGEI